MLLSNPILTACGCVNLSTRLDSRRNLPAIKGTLMIAGMIFLSPANFCDIEMFPFFSEQTNLSLMWYTDIKASWDFPENLFQI